MFNIEFGHSQIHLFTKYIKYLADDGIFKKGYLWWTSKIISFIERHIYLLNKNLFSKVFVDYYNRNRFYIKNPKLLELIKYSYILTLLYYDNKNITKCNINLIKLHKYRSFYLEDQFKRLNNIKSALLLTTVNWTIEAVLNDVDWDSISQTEQILLFSFDKMKIPAPKIKNLEKVRKLHKSKSNSRACR